MHTFVSGIVPPVHGPRITISAGSQRHICRRPSYFRLRKFNSTDLRVAFHPERRTAVFGSRQHQFSIVCNDAEDKPVPKQKKTYDMRTRLEAEVRTPFRGARTFFYTAFVGSGAIGAFFFFTKSLASISGVRGAAPLSELLPNLALQLGVIALFSYLLILEKRGEEKMRERIADRDERQRRQKKK
mmetsp:Transcript_5493/g.8534  ORF Transcript_5493/g.8534 Transcript_5493/m.8534 type:complete len:185 (+) Transcript_5493:33-587(+)